MRACDFSIRLLAQVLRSQQKRDRKIAARTSIIISQSGGLGGRRDTRVVDRVDRVVAGTSGTRGFEPRVLGCRLFI